jgi:hypothetical protein
MAAIAGDELNQSALQLFRRAEGEFSNVTRSYAGKGVAKYQW